MKPVIVGRDAQVCPSRPLNPAMRLVRWVVCACPYTLLVAALVRWGRLVLGREEARHVVKEQRLVDGVTRGRNIALIGLLCPFFWISLFNGSSAATIRLNAIHSGCVVLGGLAWMVKHLVQIEWAHRRQGTDEPGE